MRGSSDNKRMVAALTKLRRVCHKHMVQGSDPRQAMLPFEVAKALAVKVHVCHASSAFRSPKDGCRLA